MPENSEGCGDSFTFCYAVDCQVGGLVTRCQKEIRDALGDIGAMVYKRLIIIYNTNVKQHHHLRLPHTTHAQISNQGWNSFIILGLSYGEGVPALIADLSMRGVWQPQTVTLFNIGVVDNN